MSEVFATPEELLAAVGKQERVSLGAAVNELVDRVGATARVNVSAHDVPLEVFAGSRITNLRTNVDRERKVTWLSASLELDGREFSLYSKHFPIEANDSE